MNQGIEIFRRPAESSPSVESVIAAVASRHAPVILDSADSSSPASRYTIVTFDPIETFECYPRDPDPFESMHTRLQRTFVKTHNPTGGFIGGWIGYFAYEAGRYIEHLPATTDRDIDLPIARFGLYDSAAIYDAHTRNWELLAIDLRPPLPRGGWGGRNKEITPAKRLTDWDDILHKAKQSLNLQPKTPSDVIENMTREDYLEIVRQAKRFISAGDIFQVNLARRLTFAAREPASETYLRLRRQNPSAYAAFLSWDGERKAILSTSPELFLQLDGRRVTTRPIKGTRPRSDDPILDASYRAALLASPKDRAELTMIVDLERNDLGRVCEFGSVQVQTVGPSPSDIFQLETYPTVHHLVATVTGQLQPNRDCIDLLRACFPGGSITGAPKIRAMEIIDQLEPTQRSVYTGAIGYFSLNGNATFNIAIRTMILCDKQIHLQVGGGIVADSIPEDEYQETEAKALGMYRALGVADPLPSLTRRGRGRSEGRSALKSEECSTMKDLR